MVSLNAATAALHFEKPVLYYNRWTGYEAKPGEVSQLFVRATMQQIRSLQTGQRIWFEKDAIHMNGNVFGYVPRIVNDIEGGSVNFVDGYCTIEQALGKVHFAKDEEALLRFMTENPLATVVDNRFGI
jgi:hypothetical protein